MKRRRMVVVAAVLSAVPPLVAGPMPASAHVNACAGIGQIGTDRKLFFATPPIQNPLPRFEFGLDWPRLGACAAAPDPELLSGEMRGYCMSATGSGTTTSGHSFTVVWSGDKITFAGGVDGTLEIHPDATAGHSCVAGASEFTVAGALAFAP